MLRNNKEKLEGEENSGQVTIQSLGEGKFWMADDFWTKPLGGELRKAQVLIESDDQEQARPCIYTVKRILFQQKPSIMKIPRGLWERKIIAKITS